MIEFVNFCREYGLYILTFLCFVISSILTIVKRKPKSVDDFLLALSDVCADLPDIIKSVECPGKGDQKKLMVINIAHSKLEKRLSRCLSYREIETIDKKLSAQIETILSTPKKKEN